MIADAARAGVSGLRARRAALLGAAAVVLLAGCAAAPSPAPSAAAPTSAAPTPTAAAPAPAPEPLPVGVEPASIRIPAMDLSEELIDLGIDDGVMEVPEDYFDVGWFTGGGRPGGVGPTVIAGHVDDYTGPAVFFRLSELREGDTFTITDRAGDEFEYVVYATREYEKDDFPTDRVFGATADDEVRLITCGGVFDRTEGDYEGNLVVFAERAPE